MGRRFEPWVETYGSPLCLPVVRVGVYPLWRIVGGATEKEIICMSYEVGIRRVEGKQITGKILAKRVRAVSETFWEESPGQLERPTSVSLSR